jgi:uncharacterized damage-inducible protein DinB
MSLAEVQKMCQYNRWANQRVLQSLRAISQEQFTRDLKGSHGSIRGTLAHLASAEWIWLQRWTGKPGTRMLPETDFDTVDLAAQRLTQFDQDLAEYVQALSEDDLKSSKRYFTTEGKRYDNVLQDMLFHLFNHSSYHRGQIAAMLRQVDAQPQGTDFILYCRQS